MGIVVGLQSPAAEAQSKVDFAKDIQPIFQKSCVECHGPEKQKGKLRLDLKEAAMKGGAEGVIIIPGDAPKSDLYRRITLPPGHDDIMPSKGEPLSKEQSSLIRDWINQGAAWPDAAVVKSAEPTSSVQTVKAAPKPTEAELKAVAELEAAGVSARPIAMNVHWREANFHLLGSNVTDKTIAPLKSIMNLVELNLGGTKVSDAGLAAIEGLTNLTRLHLEKTDISDAALAHLKNLASLTYLNLYGTAITDAGLDHLKGLTNLKNLYLWQAKTTDAGVTNLQKSLPKLDISRGWENKPEAKVEAKPAEKAEPPK